MTVPVPNCGPLTMAGKQLTPDEVEDKVLTALPSLSASQLEVACGKVNLDVEAMKGNKKLLRNALTTHLMTTTGDDDKMTDFLTLSDHLFPEEEEPEEEPAADGTGADGTPKVKKEEENVTDTSRKVEVSKLSTATGTSMRTEKKKKPAEETVTSVTRHFRKDFKLSGMIGGTSESALSYVSLQFEIEKGRKLGHSDEEICSVVIAKVADTELREYFITEPEVKLEDVLDMLKSVCTPEKSSSVYTAFTNDKQGPNEKALSFITRVLKLRKKIVKLGQEEGRSYSEDMLAERSFEVIFGGLRDENIRSGLRDKLKDDIKMADRKIMKHAADVIANEKERKLKLFGKAVECETEDVEISELASDYSKDGGRMVKFEDKNKQANAKKKLNPFAEIEELRTEMRSKDERMAAQLNEIKQLVLNKNPASAKEPGEKPPNKCPACHAINKYRCYHCWFCGKKDHKISECPENQ